MDYFTLGIDTMAESVAPAKTPSTIKEGWLLKRGRLRHKHHRNLDTAFTETVAIHCVINFHI